MLFSDLLKAFDQGYVDYTQTSQISQTWALTKVSGNKNYNIYDV